VTTPAETIFLQESVWTINYTALRPGVALDFGLGSASQYTDWRDSLSVNKELYGVTRLEGGNITMVDGHSEYRKAAALRARHLRLANGSTGKADDTQKLRALFFTRVRLQPHEGGAQGKKQGPACLTRTLAYRFLKSVVSSVWSESTAPCRHPFRPGRPACRRPGGRAAETVLNFQFAFPPVATRNELASPAGIGAPKVNQSGEPLINQGLCRWIVHSLSLPLQDPGQLRKNHCKPPAVLS